MVLISLDIDEKIKRKVKDLGLRHAGVYMRGYNAIMDKNSYEEAIEILRKKLERVSNLLDHYVAKCVMLEDELMEMKKNVVDKKKNRK
jgi:hypothetical protein